VGKARDGLSEVFLHLDLPMMSHVQMLLGRNRRKSGALVDTSLKAVIILIPLLYVRPIFIIVLCHIIFILSLLIEVIFRDRSKLAGHLLVSVLVS